MMWRPLLLVCLAAASVHASASISCSHKNIETGILTLSLPATETKTVKLKCRDDGDKPAILKAWYGLHEIGDCQAGCGGDVNSVPEHWQDLTEIVAGVCSDDPSNCKVPTIKELEDVEDVNVTSGDGGKGVFWQVCFTCDPEVERMERRSKDEDRFSHSPRVSDILSRNMTREQKRRAFKRFRW